MKSRSSIFLHSIAMQMFLDLGWSVQLALEPWRIAIQQLAQLLHKRSPASINPVVAFTLQIACRSSTCHAYLFDPEISSSVSFLVQTLEGMGKLWSLAKVYADQAGRELFTMLRQSEAQTSETAGSVCSAQGSPMASTGAGTPEAYSTPGTVLSEDDAMLFSCFDWPKFQNDGSPVSMYSPDPSGFCQNPAV